MVELRDKTGCDIKFINLSGGVGIPYRPDQTPNDIRVIGEGVREAFEEILVPAGLGDISIYSEMGRFMLGPYGCLVTKAIHEKHTYKEYIGVDACAATLCARQFMVHIIISRSWEKKMNHAITNTM